MCVCVLGGGGGGGGYNFSFQLSKIVVHTIFLMLSFSYTCD